MAFILPVILMALGLGFQATTAPTPAGAPLPSKGRVGAKPINSELEGDVKEDGVMSFAKYEGGSFSLKQSRLTTYVNHNDIVLVQGKQRFAIPVKAVAEILDGNGVHARVGKTTGNAALTTGVKYQPAANLTVVGIVWADPEKKDGIVLRVDKGDFPAFVSALESVTGLKVSNTDSKNP